MTVGEHNNTQPNSKATQNAVASIRNGVAAVGALEGGRTHLATRLQQVHEAPAVRGRMLQLTALHCSMLFMTARIAACVAAVLCT